jgi:hypothetical protein
MPIAKLDTLIAQMRANPANVKFSDIEKVCLHYFGEPRQQGTSHQVYKTPWAGDPRINIQRDKGGKAKGYQVRQIVQARKAYGAEQ